MFALRDIVKSRSTISAFPKTGYVVKNVLRIAIRVLPQEVSGSANRVLTPTWNTKTTSAAARKTSIPLATVVSERLRESDLKAS